MATLVEILDISENDNIVISYAHTGKNKHKEYINMHSLEFAQDYWKKILLTNEHGRFTGATAIF